MSNELVITGAGDALTVYVVVRRKSDSKVWDVTCIKATFPVQFHRTQVY